MSDLFTEIMAGTPANDRFFEDNVDDTFKELPQDGFVALKDDVTSAGDLWCEEGSHWFTHTGKGRKPKSCLEHRKVTKSSSTSVSRNRLEKEVAAELAATFMMASKGVGAMAPVTAVVMAQRAVATSDAIVSMCKNNPRAMAALQKASKAAPAMTIGETIGCLVIATQVDTGRMEPDHFICTLTEVDKAYTMVHGPYVKPRASVSTQLMDEFIPIA